MQKVKKDNLTDLVDEVTKPQEANPKPNEPTPQPKPQGGLSDYQELRLMAKSSISHYRQLIKVGISSRYLVE